MRWCKMMLIPFLYGMLSSSCLVAAPVTNVNQAACGNLTSLDLTKNSLDLSTDSTSCTQSNTPTFSVTDKTITSMDEFTQQTLDVALGVSGNKSTVTLKQALSSRLGVTPSVSGTNVTYTAPAYVAGNNNDFLYFLLEDSETPPNVAVGRLIVSEIMDVAGSVPTNGCTDLKPLTCMKPLEWGFSSARFNELFPYGVGSINAYRFDLIPGKKMQVDLVDSELVEVSVSLVAGDMGSPLASACYRASESTVSMTIVDATIGASYYCNVNLDSVTHSASVYLNIKMLADVGNGTNNTYDITWADLSNN